jgi:hypothetical protein
MVLATAATAITRPHMTLFAVLGYPSTAYPMI